MPLTGTGIIWRDAIISAIGIDFTGMTTAEENLVKDAWLALCNTHISHITGNALVGTTVTGVTGTGTPGGPLPIVSQPGTGGIT